MKKTLLSCGLTALLLGCGTLPASGPYGTKMGTGDLKIDISSVQQGDEVLRYAVADVNQALLSFLDKYRPEANPQENWPGNDASEEIKVNIGDTIQISIFESQSGGLFIPEDSSVRPGNFVSLPSQTIDYTGLITVPYAGQVQAAGRTTEEISADIVQRLSNKAIEPQVVVSFNSRDGAEVSVIGAVNNASRLSLGFNKYKMLDAIAAAGGPTSPGFETKVSLQRDDKEYDIRFDRLVEDSDKNIYAEVNDTIYLYREPEIFIAHGAVQNQGAISFGKRRLNLSEALGLASGLSDDRADPAEVYIYRQRKYPYFEKLSQVNSQTTNVMTTITGGHLAYSMETHDEESEETLNEAAPQLVYGGSAKNVANTKEDDVAANVSFEREVYQPLTSLSAEDLATVQDKNKIKLIPVTPTVPSTPVVMQSPEIISETVILEQITPPAKTLINVVSDNRDEVAVNVSQQGVSDGIDIAQPFPISTVSPLVFEDGYSRVSTPVQIDDYGDSRPVIRKSTLSRVSLPALSDSVGPRVVAVAPQEIASQQVVEPQQNIKLSAEPEIEEPVVVQPNIDSTMQIEPVAAPTITVPQSDNSNIRLVFDEKSEGYYDDADNSISSVPAPIVVEDDLDVAVNDVVKPVMIEKVYNEDVPFLGERGLDAHVVETPSVDVPAPVMPAVMAPAPKVTETPIRQPQTQIQQVTETTSVVTSDEGVSIIFKLDLRDPRSFFLAQNFQMEDQDIIYVANAKSVEFSKFLSILNLSSTTTTATDTAKERF